MAQIEIPESSKIYRGTIDEVLSHRSEIPAGATVELKILVNPPNAVDETPTMALMRSWLEEDATDNPTEKKIAEQELAEFKRNMNQPRKESGARLLYPEAE